jgi:hypothetical protein
MTKTNTMNKFFTLAFLLIIQFGANAQETETDKNGTENLYNVIPPSPTAASLGKYGDIPVGFHTGIPQINIPLWEVSQGSLRLPISMSYHASGIKVAEQASWVGLGWSLSAGGVITRTVRGIPDDSQNGGFYYTPVKIPAIINDEEYLKSIIEGLTDSEPDLFFFNFAGYSGKFSFDQSGNIHVTPYQKIKVEKTEDSEGIVQFIVTTEDGTKFYFGKGLESETAYEVSKAISTPNKSFELPFRSSWFLTDIVSANKKDIINLKYTSHYLRNDFNSFESTKFGITEGGPCQMGSQGYSTGKSTVEILGAKRLSEILFSNGKIVFTGSQKREDTVYDYQLDEIRVEDSEEKVIRKFNFSYSYFLSSSNANQLGKRLRLDAIAESSGDIKKPPYQFYYNSMPLPSA